MTDEDLSQAMFTLVEEFLKSSPAPTEVSTQYAKLAVASTLVGLETGQAISERGMPKSNSDRLSVVLNRCLDTVMTVAGPALVDEDLEGIAADLDITLSIDPQFDEKIPNKEVQSAQASLKSN